MLASLAHLPWRRIGWPAAFVTLLILLALLAPVIAPHDPVKMDVGARLAGPSAQHWLGQDEFGRDVLSRLLWGARASLAVALMSALIAALIGVAIGLIGGYFGGIAELLTVRLTDVILSFPPILLALLIVTLVGPGAGTLIFALSILYAPGYARVTFGEVLSARQLEYVEAARASGATPFRVLSRTILPNVFPPILVQFSLTVGAAIVIESGLSFLGLGVVPPTPSWGLMIRGARATMEQNWLLLLWPCAALVLTILAVNRLCDALRDAFDPRLTSLAPHATMADALIQRRSPVRTACPTGTAPLIEIQHLETRFDTADGPFKAVAGVSFAIHRGETVAIVGESGSGKSMTGLSILGLVPKPAGRIAAGSIFFTGRDGARRDLLQLDETNLQGVRGNEIAMIFQEPMTSLNPVYSVGEQIGEAIRRHRAISRTEAHREAVRLLDSVGIPDAPRRVDDFPHQLSGGMRQRAMIAMALACDPVLLIADEPTTALDVTIQAQILDLLRTLGRDGNRPLSMMFITHNLGIVAELADRVIVLYAGRIMEEGDVRAIFRRPRHPYTRGLLASMPEAGVSQLDSRDRPPLRAISGQVPSPLNLPPGCPFETRCDMAQPACRVEVPVLADAGDGHRSRCLRWSEL
ncbi:MAG: dipeptide/oligopeptide/nickel ABC transporter permease/ATP-binding protein [Hyphomicrobiaceae bacterium]